MFSVIFPGQGSQIVGMGKEFYEKYEIVKKLFREADDVLGINISKIILEGPKDDLNQTVNTQPAIFLISYSIYQVIKNEFNINLDKGKYFAGHSLGEYCALVCAGSLDFNDALYLLHERGKSMQEAVPLGEGKMLAILGAKVEDVKEMIKNLNNQKGICEIANDNAEGQVIVSGDKITINLFQNFLKEKKIKSIPLKVSAPFHCSLMKKAANNMREKILNTEFQKPVFEIINNVTAEPVIEPKKIKDLLISQICATVKWRESLIHMSNSGINNYVEIGPGKVLTGMVKRTIKNSKCFSINSIADIKNLKNELKK